MTPTHKITYRSDRTGMARITDGGILYDTRSRAFCPSDLGVNIWGTAVVNGISVRADGSPGAYTRGVQYRHDGGFVGEPFGQSPCPDWLLAIIRKLAGKP